MPPPPEDVGILFERCLAAPPASRESTLEQLCREHPAHAPRLRAMYSRLAALGMLAGEGSDVLAIGPGVEIGGCRIEDVLGRGGIGVVFRARQTSLGGRPVALKLVRPELVHDPRARLRFLREAELAARIDHPNVCTILDVGQHGDHPYLVLQFVEGEPLDRILARARACSTAKAMCCTT